jgi:hypothetical protein
MRKGEEMKILFLLATIATCIASSSFALAETKKDTAITVYSTSVIGDDFSLIVLRQAPRKINLILCSKAYKGTLTDATSVRKFYENAFKEIDGTVYCTNLDKVESFSKRKIEEEDNLVRYVYTNAGDSNVTANGGIGSGVSTYTVDANDDFGQDASNDNVLLLASFIIHIKIENPILNTTRATYKLIGRAMIKLPEIK